MSADDERPKWVHKTGDEYLPIACTAWMNEHDCGFNYTALEQASTSCHRAINRGLKLQGSDDFNIGVIRGNRLVATLWMHTIVDDDPTELADTAEQLGLQVGDR